VGDLLERREGHNGAAAKLGSARLSFRDAYRLRRSTVPGAAHVRRRLCAAAREYILFETAGGSDGSHKSIAVGFGRGAGVRVARHRASFFFRGVRLGQDRDLAGNYLQSRLGQSAHLRLSGHKDDAGKTTTWELQSLPPLFFRGSGLTKDVLLSTKQEVTVTANPAKDGTRAYGFMIKLSYPDGHVFSMSPQDADPNLRRTQK
jgi:hypothetical protein